MAFYTVQLLDKDGHELMVHQDVNGLKEAKRDAKAMLKDPEYANDAYTSQIWSDDNEIIHDFFKE